jgi:hypothetical protein
MITTDYKKANHMNQQKSDLSVSKVAMNLKVHVIPVSDVERSKEFYQRLGWRLDEAWLVQEVTTRRPGR